jgi:hypothetical protein
MFTKSSFVTMSRTTRILGVVQSKILIGSRKPIHCGPPLYKLSSSKRTRGKEFEPREIKRAAAGLPTQKNININMASYIGRSLTN